MRLPPPRHTTVHAPHLAGIPERRAAPTFTPHSSPFTLPRLALGDLVYRVADPIARLMDCCTARLPARLRTHVAGCSACSRRRRRLNALAPDLLGFLRSPLLCLKKYL